MPGSGLMLKNCWSCPSCTKPDVVRSYTFIRNLINFKLANTAMNHNKQTITSTPDKKAYWFISSGVKDVQKAVFMQKMDEPGRFNLAMADIIDGKKDFENRTNNRDLEIVFGSIADIVLDFNGRYPKAEIYITGNTKSKTRMYQIQIAKHLTEIEEHYDVYGHIQKNGDFTRFKKGVNYLGILISPKNGKFSI